MAWFRCIGNNGGGGGGNYTDSLWDGTLIPDVYIERNGVETPYNGWSATDYLEIPNVSTIYRAGNITTANYNAWYDDTKTFISYFGGGSVDTVPNNAKYVRYSYSTGVMVGKFFTEV